MAKLNVPVALIEAYMEAIKADYANWKPSYGVSDEITKRIREESIANFNVMYDVGSTYIKIFTNHAGRNTSVHSFVVNKPTKGFKVGQILKAASWKAPATNFARGEITALTPNVTNWTGAQ